MENSVEKIQTWLSDPTVGRIVLALVIGLVCIAIVRFVQGLVARYVEERNTRYRVRKVIGFIGYTTAVILLASVFSEKMTQFTVVFGVAGAGIAFALQEVIASLAGFAALSFGGFYKVGDRVQLGGIRGDVIDIGMLRTTLMEIGAWVNGDLYNGRVVRVANSFVFKEPVLNYSGDFPFLWDEIFVPIRFGSDLGRSQEIFEKAVHEVTASFQNEATKIWRDIQKKYPLEDATVKPVVSLAFDHNWITYTIRYPVRFDKRRSTKDLLSRKILSEIDASANQVSVAASAVELLPRMPFDVRLSEYGNS